MVQPLLSFFISFPIVALGTPAIAPWLAPLAAACGYALFWRTLPSLAKPFLTSTLWYGSVSLVQLSWMSSIEYQGIYILFVWVCLSIALGLQFGLLSYFISRFPNRLLAIAALWTLLEWSRFFFLCGFSWNFSGLALSNPYAMQMAALFGVLGLSFWVILVNLLFFQQRYKTWVIAALLPYLFGAFHIAYHNKHMANAPSYTCALIQTGLLPSEKIPLFSKLDDFVSPYEQWQRIFSHLSKTGLSHFDLIALPEAALPFESSECIYKLEVAKNVLPQNAALPPMHFPYGDPRTQKVSNAFFVQALANIYNSEVVIGLDHVDPFGEIHNAAFFAKPTAQKMERYDKRVLMPLAEYLPFSWALPLVKSYGISQFCTPGKEAIVFAGKQPLSVSICYEETFPQRVREGRKNGAKILVNVTNDGWYPFSRLPRQHFVHAKFRTVENGAPLLRACNNGVSAAIDSLGRCKALMEESTNNKTLQSGALVSHIPLYTYQTPYLLYGDIPLLCLCFFFLGLDRRQRFLMRVRTFWSPSRR